MVPGLEIDVREELGPERIGPGEHDADRMANGLDQGAEHDRHVIAIAGLQFEHAPCGMQHFDAEGILGVSNVALDPAEQRIDLTNVILSGHSALDQDVDRFLPHVEIGGAVANQAPDVGGGRPRALQAAGDPVAIDAGRLG